jgi:hypothetical protein
MARRYNLPDVPTHDLPENYELEKELNKLKKALPHAPSHKLPERYISPETIKRQNIQKMRDELAVNRAVRDFDRGLVKGLAEVRRLEDERRAEERRAEREARAQAECKKDERGGCITSGGKSRRRTKRTRRTRRTRKGRSKKGRKTRRHH